MVLLASIASAGQCPYRLVAAAKCGVKADAPRVHVPTPTPRKFPFASLNTSGSAILLCVESLYSFPSPVYELPFDIVPTSGTPVELHVCPPSVDWYIWWLCEFSCVSVAMKTSFAFPPASHGRSPS